jgi:hypothetical protein
MTASDPTPRTQLYSYFVDMRALFIIYRVLKTCILTTNRLENIHTRELKYT